MVKKTKEQRHKELLQCICAVPRKMTLIHGIENMTEFLLYHLAAPECFNFSKAAYLVDNPDFDQFKGVVGFDKQHSFDKDHWTVPEQFSQHMRQGGFNKKVRSLGKKSHKRSQQDDQQLINALVEELELENPGYHSWKMKYDNHGILLFEFDEPEDQEMDQALQDSLYLFGFCPVF